MRFYRDYHLRPLVLLKLAICRLHLAGAFDLTEFCHRCGDRQPQHWWSPPWLWREVLGVGDAGVRCIACFDRECHERGIEVRWTPLIERRRDTQGRWSDAAPPDPEFFPVAARLHAEGRAT